MKPSSKLAGLLTLTALLIVAHGAHAQNGLFLMNLDNTSTNSSATSNGLFWVSSSGTTTLVTNNFNAAFYGGTNATNLSLLATFLLSDGTATGDLVWPGIFMDPAGAERIITNASDWAYLQVQAWFGTNTSYAAAVAAGAYAGQSTVFSNGVAGPPGIPPDLTGMPAVVLTAAGGGSSPIFSGGGVSSSGGSSPSGPSGPLDLISTSTTCGLWLSVATSNTTAAVTLHNTHAGETYLLWSTQVVSAPFTNWGLEASVVGAAGDTTQTNIAMNGRSDLFFRATEYVTNTVFQGLGFADSYGANPDTIGAVSQNYFCEIVNGFPSTNDPAFAVYSKSGSNPAKTNINAFFSVPADGTNYPTGLGTMTDPRIIYDSQSQCFVATAIDFTSKQVILAVCTNADNATNLTTGWTRYVLHVLQSGSTISDFDTLAVDANGIYLSVLQGNSTHSIVAIKKPDIYLGTMTATYLTNAASNADSNIVTLQPAVNFDALATNGSTWFVGKGLANLSGTYQGASIYYRRLKWSATNAAWADTNGFSVLSSTNYLDYFDLDPTNYNAAVGISAPQLPNTTNTAITLYAVGSRLAQAVIRNGFLWTCHTVGLTTNGTYNGDASGSNVTRSGVQWFKLQISSDSSSLSLADHGRIFDSSQSDNPWWYYFPSIMVNRADEMVAGFSGSTATNYLSALYSWRLSNGTGSVPTVFQAGTTNAPSRSGDYSATTLDPTDDCTFWTVQAYGAPWLTFQRWGTAISRVRPNP